MREVSDQVSIGDMMDAEHYGSLFDVVVSLAAEEYTTSYPHLEHYPLVDGDNDPEDFAEAVQIVRDILQSDKTVLVHCQAGASRSVTVLATAIAAENDIRFQDALYKCQMTGVYPAPELLDLAKAYLPDSLTDTLPFRQ